MGVLLQLYIFETQVCIYFGIGIAYTTNLFTVRDFSKNSKVRMSAIGSIFSKFTKKDCNFQLTRKIISRN